MYDRNYAGETLSFEPSGGLMNASLIMQDKQTDTYWSIMSGRAEAGRLAGTRLREIPAGEKTTWAEWVAKHPDTLVLSVMQRTRDGRTVAVQDPGSNVYGEYFAGAAGFRGVEATDPRLETKSPIHAFLHDGVPYAIDLGRAAGGRVYELDDGTHVFIFREASDEVYRGSAAFVSRAGFERRGETWVELATGAELNVARRDFDGGMLRRLQVAMGGSGPVERLNGFDTFWYTWSLTHKDTKLLR